MSNILNLNDADKLYWGNTEVERLYKGSELLYPQSNFSPLELSPALWLDADDSSTITTVSGAISEWRDKSGNNRHATQAGASSRPLFITNGLNNTSVIRFDGSNDFLEISNTLLQIPQPFTVFTTCMSAVSNLVASRRAYIFDIFVPTPSPTRSLFSLMGGNLANSSAAGFNSIYSQSWGISNFPIDTNYHFFSLIYNSTNSIVCRDGNVRNVSVGTIGLEGMKIGTNYQNNADWLTGNISEIILFDRVLTQTEREKVEGYLAHKTGLQGNLPVSHPYKTIAP